MPPQPQPTPASSSGGGVGSTPSSASSTPSSSSTPSPSASGGGSSSSSASSSASGSVSSGGSSTSSSSSPSTYISDTERTLETPKIIQRIKNLKRTISDIEREVITLEKQLTIKLNKALTRRLLGRILLQVETLGQAWYVDPITESRYYLQNGESAYQALQVFGLGITNADLASIPICLPTFAKATAGEEDRAEIIDSDGDGLDDQLEDSIGTDKHNPDTDGDGINDGDEIKADFDPLNPNPVKLAYARPGASQALRDRLTGRILLQVENHGESWYVHEGCRYYMKNGRLAYQIMRFLSLGITNSDLRQIGVGELE